MDKFGLTDADALQSLLTGHTQVADPKRVGLEPGSVYNDSGADQVWLKPAWVEADDEPLYYRALAFQRWIRPLNAPMDPMLYNENLKEMRQRGFIWEMLPEEEFVTASHTLLKNWSLRYGRSLGSIRVDGTRNGNVRSVQLNCQTKTFLSMPENKGSFLFRPESHKVTWEKFCDVRALSQLLPFNLNFMPITFCPLPRISPSRHPRWPELFSTAASSPLGRNARSRGFTASLPPLYTARASRGRAQGAKRRTGSGSGRLSSPQSHCVGRGLMRGTVLIGASACGSVHV
jgi:hypothetical protein